MKLLVILAALVLPAAAYAGTATATGPAGSVSATTGSSGASARAAAARPTPAPLRATQPPMVLEARPRRRPAWAQARLRLALMAAQRRTCGHRFLGCCVFDPRFWRPRRGGLRRGFERHGGSMVRVVVEFTIAVTPIDRGR